MPTVPVADNLGDAQAQPFRSQQNIQAPAGAFGANEAQATANFGGAVEGVAKQGLSIREKYLQEQDALNVEDTISTIRRDASAKLFGGADSKGNEEANPIMARKGADAAGATQEMAAWYDQAKTTYGRNISKNGREAFGLKLYSLRNEHLNQVTGHEFTQGEARKEITLQNQFNDLVKQSEVNPNSANAYRDQMMGDVAAFVRDPVLKQSWMDKFDEHQAKAVSDNVISGVETQTQAMLSALSEGGGTNDPSAWHTFQTDLDALQSKLNTKAPDGTRIIAQSKAIATMQSVKDHAARISLDAQVNKLTTPEQLHQMAADLRGGKATMRWYANGADGQHGLAVVPVSSAIMDIDPFANKAEAMATRMEIEARREAATASQSVKMDAIEQTKRYEDSIKLRDTTVPIPSDETIKIAGHDPAVFKEGAKILDANVTKGAEAYARPFSDKANQEWVAQQDPIVKETVINELNKAREKAQKDSFAYINEINPKLNAEYMTAVSSGKSELFNAFLSHTDAAFAAQGIDTPFRKYMTNEQAEIMARRIDERRPDGTRVDVRKTIGELEAIKAKYGESRYPSVFNQIEKKGGLDSYFGVLMNEPVGVQQRLLPAIQDSVKIKEAFSDAHEPKDQTALDSAIAKGIKPFVDTLPIANIGLAADWHRAIDLYAKQGMLRGDAGFETPERAGATAAAHLLSPWEFVGKARVSKEEVVKRRLSMDNITSALGKAGVEEYLKGNSHVAGQSTPRSLALNSFFMASPNEDGFYLIESSKTGAPMQWADTETEPTKKRRPVFVSLEMMDKIGQRVLMQTHDIANALMVNTGTF